MNDQIKKLKAQLQEEIDSRTGSDAAKRRALLENETLVEDVAKLECEVTKNKQELEELRKSKKDPNERSASSCRYLAGFR